MAEGYVYILLNPALRGQVKIGRTTNSPEDRAAELSGTGLPHEFVVAYAERVSDCESVERLLHEKFAAVRVNPSREFFRVTVHEAVRAAIELATPYRIGEGEVAAPVRPTTHQAARPQTSASARTHRTPPAGAARGRLKFTVSLRPTCPKCGTVYAITLRRYEYHVRCPACFGLDAAGVDWD